MNVLAVVPARGGSKGVPRKNIREVGGKPLLVWSVEAALSAKLVDMVVVSSDDQEILEAGRRAGAVGMERPALFSGDKATLDEVAAHVIRNLAAYHANIVVTLQPTVPIRRPNLVDDCIQRLFDTDADCVFTATKVTNCWHRTDDNEWAEEARWVSNNPQMLQRQDIPRNALHWAKDGSVVVTRRYMLVSDDPGRLRSPRLIGGRVQPYPNERTVDIDTEQDLRIADALLSPRVAAIA